MKVAIVHDELMRRGGAEQVVRCFHQAFPEAPIYTMAYRPDFTYPDFKNCKIICSWFNKIAFSENIMRRLFFPLGLLAMKNLEIKGFDVILISSTYAAKYVKVPRNSIVINYCHTPFRLAWYPESYSQYTNSKGLLRFAFNKIIGFLKKVDFKAAQRTNFFIANTSEVKNRIESIYQHKQEIAVIKPPVNCNRFYASENIKNYYLVVSRLESYKKVDLIIDTFNQLGLPLIVVGKGSMEEKLKKLANPNIKFLNGLNADDLAKLYSECKAFIFPQKEDYGITPLEANASGRPVIAYGKGGVLETMIPYTGNASKATALFFNEQTKESIIDAVQNFEKLEFSPEFIRNHAKKFDESNFISEIKNFVSSHSTTHFGTKTISDTDFPLNVKIA